jgi:F-type H+-transporting ATPase subunit epsilon
MESGFQLVLLTPEKTVLDREVVSIIAPGSEGFLGVLAHHAPLITGLVPGPLAITYAAGRKGVFFLSGGFLEVSHNRATILADAVERPDEIDVARAEAARDRARKRLSPPQLPDLDVDRAEVALKRALIRIRVAERHGA